MKMIICKSCGAETVSHNKKCGHCGHDTGYAHEVLARTVKIFLCICIAAAVLACAGMLVIDDETNIDEIKIETSEGLEP